MLLANIRTASIPHCQVFQFSVTIVIPALRIRFCSLALECRLAPTRPKASSPISFPRIIPQPYTKGRNAFRLGLSQAALRAEGLNTSGEGGGGSGEKKEAAARRVSWTRSRSRAALSSLRRRGRWRRPREEPTRT